MEIRKVGLFQMPTDSFNGDLKKVTDFVSFWNEKWDWDDNFPLNKQGKGMRTYLVKRNILSENFETTFYPGSANNFERKLYLNNCINRALSDFNEKKEKINDDLIFNAFNAIQYWGAITGRTFYQKNGLNENNFNEFKLHWVENVKPIYLSILLEIQNEKLDLCKLIAFFDNIEGIGVSFGTKHLNFWSRAFGNENILPIYDKNIFQLLRAEIRNDRYPNWSQYYQVVEEFEKLGNKIGKTSSDIEKAFFAFHSKVGIRKNNFVPAQFATDQFTIEFNSFLNQRLKISLCPN